VSASAAGLTRTIMSLTWTWRDTAGGLQVNEPTASGTCMHTCGVPNYPKHICDCK
jgi:hypothetical protein